MVTIADLQRISATALSKQILEEQNVQDPTVAVVDVRDNGILQLLPS
jgi:hypothetical protein